jgi:hypothetical protein
MESRGADHIQALEARGKPAEIPKPTSKQISFNKFQGICSSVPLNIEIWRFLGVWAALGFGASAGAGVNVENDGCR